MASQDQEKTAANLLRQSLRDSGGDCPGPDILAAYFERSLDVEESARYERHLSRCTRCREQLAALDRAATPDLAGSAPLHQRFFGPWLWDWRWLAPVAAALLVAAVWMARRPTPKRADEPPPLVAMSQPEQAPTASTAPESGHENKPAPGGVPAAKSAPNLTGDLGPREKTSPRAAPPPSSKEAETDSLVGGNAAAAPMPPASASESGAARAVGGRLEQEATTSDAQTISREPSTMEMKSHSVSAARVSAQGAKAEARTLEAVNRRSTREIISTPNPKVLWRIAEGGFVERTQDGGVSWQAQLPAAGVQPTAGSAPSETVCWLAGRDSMIALTTNAKDWKRIPPPVAADFVAITALDVSTATVTTADGRKFTTSDDGIDWKPVP